MSIKASPAQITTENPRFKNTPSTPKEIISTTIKNPNAEIDLTDLHEAAQDFDKSIETLAKKYQFKEKNDKSSLGSIEKFLLDNSKRRIYFSLGNEVAESFKDLAYHILPKPIAMLFYGSTWSASLFATGARVYANADQAKPEDKMKAGTKMLAHDGIATLGGTTIVAKTMNALQNTLFQPIPLPQALKHFIKSLITLFTCKVAIGKLDPYALKFSSWLTGHTEDRYKDVNKAAA